MAIYEILFNVDSIQALQCEIFSYVYELNLYSVYSWQIIILLELSRHPIELSIKLIVLSILFYSVVLSKFYRLVASHFYPYLRIGDFGVYRLQLDPSLMPPEIYLN